MEEAPENGKESLHSAHADGMNEYQYISHYSESETVTSSESLLPQFNDKYVQSCVT